MYICMQVCMYVFMYVCMHDYICIYVYMYVFYFGMQMFACTLIFMIYVSTQECLYPCIHKSMQVNVSMSLYIPMQGYILYILYICMLSLCIHVYVFLTTCVYCLFSIHIFLRMLVTISIYIIIYFNLFISLYVSTYVAVQVYILYIPIYT